MWTQAQDVPKSSADAVLERFDKTDHKLQRMITLQYILNATNTEGYVQYLLEGIESANREGIQFMPKSYEQWLIMENGDKASTIGLEKLILGPTYGGPSISYDKDKDEFVVYTWSDAPVGDYVTGRGKTIQAALIDHQTRGGKEYLDG